MMTEPKKSVPKNIVIDNLWLILMGFLLYFIYLLLPVLTPFLIAAVLSYIFNPIVERLCLIGFDKFRLTRAGATTIVMVSIFSTLSILIVVIVPLLQKETLLILAQLPKAIDNVRNLIEPWLLTNFGIHFSFDSTQIEEIITKNWKTAGGFLGDALQMAGNHGIALIGLAANTLLLPVVLFYLLRDWDAFINSITELIPLRCLEQTRSITREMDEVLAEFLRGQLSVMVAMSFFYTVGLWMTGLSMALPIGLIAGLLGFVPYLGIATGITLALLVAALQFSHFGQIIPVLIVFGLGQLLEGMVLTPKLVGSRIGLHPIIVIFALLAGSQLFGFTGVLLALPVSAAIAVGFRRLKILYLSSAIYTSNNHSQ